MDDRETFEWLKNQRAINGIPGVVCINKGLPNRSDLLIIGSHGKEVTSGLGAARFLLENPSLQESNTQLFIAIGNIDAATLAMEAPNLEEQLKFRYCPGGRDMNRLPANPADLEGIKAPEARRVEALRSIFVPLKLQYVFDLHSTDGPSEPAGLGIVDKVDKTAWLFDRLSVRSVIANVVGVQANYGTKTQTLSSILEPDMAVEIEVGQTGTPEAQSTGTSLFMQWATAIGLIKGSAAAAERKPTYKMVNSVMAPDTSYVVADKRFLEDKCPISVGEILLRNPAGNVITAPCSGYGFWGPEKLQLSDTDVTSEIWFIAEKVS